MLLRLLAIFGLLMTFAAPAWAADDVRTITVRGTGSANARPDIAELSAGIVEQAPTAAAAMAKVSTQAAALIEVLRGLGIAERDLETTGLSLHPLYPRRQDDDSVPQPVAFRAVSQVNVRLRDLDRTGELLDRMLAAGVNEFSGIRFAIADPAALLDQARRKAMADARARAELYADAAGGSVGAVLSVREDLASTPRPVERLMAAQASSPIAPGEQEIDAAVSVVFELR